MKRTRATLLGQYHIDQSWGLCDNYSDLAAKLVKNQTSPFIRNMFAADAACFQMFSEAAATTMADECAKEVAELLAQAPAADGPVLTSVAADNKRKAKARRPAPPPEALGVALVVKDSQ